MADILTVQVENTEATLTPTTCVNGTQFYNVVLDTEDDLGDWPLIFVEGEILNWLDANFEPEFTDHTDRF